ncbi:unnamed protein product [Cunninghamella blakesleeana]
MSIASIQSYYASILNHNIPYEPISKIDKHKRKKRKEHKKGSNLLVPSPLTNNSIVTEWIRSFIYQQKKQTFSIEGFMPRRKSSSSIALTSLDVLSISSTNKNKIDHQYKSKPIKSTSLLFSLLNNYNNINHNNRNHIQGEVLPTNNIDELTLIEPYSHPIQRTSSPNIYTTRELRTNPDYLRMLVAEINMVRANKIVGSLRPRHYLPKRQDPIHYSPSLLRQEL